MTKPDDDVPPTYNDVTADEKRNGWDEASLRKYLESRNEVQAQKIDPRQRRVRPNEQNHRYKPHRWRQ